MSTIKIKRHDLDTPLRATLKEDGAAVNLAGYDVFFVLGTPQSMQIFRRACVVEDAAAGKVRYDWQTGDNAAVGGFRAEFEAVAQATGRKKTFPNDGYIRLEVVEDLGAD